MITTKEYSSLNEYTKFEYKISIYLDFTIEEIQEFLIKLGYKIKINLCNYRYSNHNYEMVNEIKKCIIAYKEGDIIPEIVEEDNNVEIKKVFNKEFKNKLLSI